ncbi:MAG: hypothetical protein Q7S19_03320 [bacterium]|nr:hypothetical protein [bacterium]
MAEPLFSAEESSLHKSEIDKLREERKYDEIENVRQAFMLEGVRRAQSRPEELLNGMIICVGSRGHKYVLLDEAFTHSDSKKNKDALNSFDTPEARRNLYTILRALVEVPRSWAWSAFTRFLRGIGKQNGAKYHGAGMFSVRYGWKEREVSAIAYVMTCDSYRGYTTYSSVLMSYADTMKEIEEEDRYNRAKFYAVRAERDIPFLNKLCEMLEARGLGPIPALPDEKPKKEREIKIFKAGDIVRQKDLRDLPLPALVRISVTKIFKGKEGEKDQRVAGQMDEVITRIHEKHYYDYYVVAKDGKAYKYFMGYSFKTNLDGATFLGEWKGEIVKNKEIKLDFHYYKN